MRTFLNMFFGVGGGAPTGESESESESGEGGGRIAERRVGD